MVIYDDNDNKPCGEDFIIRVDGRNVAVQAAAQKANCVPVIVSYGSGRRLFERDVASADARGLWLLGYDRPGLGRSDPHPGRTVADCAADVRAIAQQFGFEKFAVFGTSGGSTYALACASVLADQVLACSVFGAMVPADTPEVDTDSTLSDEILEYEALRSNAEGREVFRDYVTLVNTRYSVAENWLERWGTRAEVDAAHDRKRAEFLAACHRDALESGGEGEWEDFQARSRPWGFEFGAIKCPVQIWHGSADKHVDKKHSEWLSTVIPDADLRITEGQDHTNIVELNRDAAFAWLASICSR